MNSGKSRLSRNVRWQPLARIAADGRESRFCTCISRRERWHRLPAAGCRFRAPCRAGLRECRLVPESRKPVAPGRGRA